MKINRVNLDRLRNEAHYQFIVAVIALTVKYPFIVEKISGLLTLLQNLFTKEDEAVDYIRKSDYSAKIAEADRRLDNAVTGFVEAIRSALHHFSFDVADAAQSLTNLLKTYGNIIHKNYDEELAAVTNLLQELDGAYKPKADLIAGLPEWITEIRAAGENVAALLALRTAEKAGKTRERMSNVRREVDHAYRDIVAKIEALALVEGETAYEPFISELNALVERFNRIRSHKTEKAGDQEPKP
jgi:hypothetical protein